MPHCASVGFLEWLLGTPADQVRSAPEEFLHDPSTALTPPARADVDPRAVSSTDALGLGAVFRAVEIRAVAAKQISIEVEKDGRVVDDPPRIIRRPDPDRSRASFVEQTVVSLNLTGNAYWRLVRDAKNQVTSVWVMNPHDVEIDRTTGGRVTGYRYRQDKLRPTDVAHLSRLRIPGEAKGMGPIQAAQLELRGILDTAVYGSETLYRADVPTGILKSDSILTPDQASIARKQWDETRGGRRGVAVMGSGLAYQQVFLSPKDAQFIESQQWGVQQVARLFGIPASLMLITLEGSSQTYANVEQDWLGFVRFGLMNDLNEIEDALTDLIPRGQRAKFNIEALLRADTKSRYDSYESALRAGWMIPDEVRKIEGLDPLPAPQEVQA